MSASLNAVFLAGNLTRDPELKYLPSGQAVCTFSIAVNRSYKTDKGETKEEVSFIRIVTWARLAENCNEFLKKGSSVLVDGRIQSRSWEAQDGTKRSALEVIAARVQFLSTPKNKEAEDVKKPEGRSVKTATAGEISAEELTPDEDVPF